MTKYFDTLFYVGLMLIVLWFVVVKLNFSLPRLVRGIVKEIGPLAERQWTRASVNGLLIIVLALLIILYFFVDRFKQAIEILHNLNQQHSSASSTYEIVFAIFVVAIVGLLSLFALPKA